MISFPVSGLYIFELTTLGANALYRAKKPLSEAPYDSTRQCGKGWLFSPALVRN